MGTTRFSQTFVQTYKGKTYLISPFFNVSQTIKIFTQVILFISSDPSVNLPCEEQAKIFPHFTDRPQKVYVGT